MKRGRLEVPGQTVGRAPPHPRRGAWRGGPRHPFFGAEAKQLTRDRLGAQAHARRGYAIATGYGTLFADPPAATAYSMEGRAHLVLSGRFVSFLPRHYAAQWVEAGRMRALRPDLVQEDEIKDDSLVPINLD